MSGGLTGPEAGSGADESDEILDAGGTRAAWLGRLIGARPAQRPPRSPLVRALGLALALAVGLTIGLAMHRTHRQSPAAVVPHDAARISTATVRALATDSTRLHDYVRQASTEGACALVPVGHSPVRVVTATVRREFPGYRFRDSARAIDQFTGLCSLELRAARGGSVVVVDIASPPARPRRPVPYTQVETGIETQGSVTTKYAYAVNQAGWTVLVGASGRGADLPGAQDLVRFAQEPALIW